MTDAANSWMTQTEKPALATPKARCKRRNRCRVPVAIFTGCLLALNAATSLLIVRYSQTPVVAFNMKATLDTFMDQSAKQTLSPDAAADLSSRFSDAVAASLHEWQTEHHALILVTPAVVAGAPDITEAIQKQIAGRMRGGRDD